MPQTKLDSRGRQQPQYRHICPECNAPFTGSIVATFCTPKHKQAFHGRSMKRGQVMMPLVIAWRSGRGQKEVSRWAYGEMCRLADLWASEDREAGRAPQAAYVAGKKAAGWSAVDYFCGNT